MRIFEVLDRDPRTTALANNGQARITPLGDARAVQELRDELATFVCDGQYADAIQRILESYLTQLQRPRQNAAWVSGFFGSGKSHLLKMLGHLWVNTAFPDGSTARSLVRALPEEVTARLRELDVQVARSGRGPVAAAGTMPSGTGAQVRLAILDILLRGCGLPEGYPQAQFCLWLRDRGYLDQVRMAVEADGRPWDRELNNLYVSGPIARAVLACEPDFAQDEKQARQVLREQFPRRQTDITTQEFLDTARRALGGSPPPLTLLVLDEVQQYIGGSRERASTVAEVVEAVYTQLDSRVMLVASGQSALTDTPDLQWLRDRFAIRTHLSDAYVEMVTRRVLLHKKPSGVDPVRRMAEQSAGEIARHLQGTGLAARAEDRNLIVEDYPLLPTRRRLWEECFRAVDAAGTQSQLRSQLRILDDALKAVAEREMGAVIPADALYEAIAPDLVNTGVLLGEIATRIQSLSDGTEDGRLKQRICGLVFLIGKLPREAAVDSGVRATPRVLADVLVEDLGSDSSSLRRRVEAALQSLADAGTLMRLDEEYRLQTAEGAEWERAFREKVTALEQREGDVAARRDQLLHAAAEKTVGDIRLSHGAAKLRRSITLHVGANAETLPSGDHVVVWVRHGWEVAQKDVEAEARQRGPEDAVVHVFLPREAHDALRTRIIEAEAAQSVLDAKGSPGSGPGKDARASMEGRLRDAALVRDDLITRVLAAATVLQGGGTEVQGDSLALRVQQAAEASLARLFPRFHEGDHANWPAALERARQGSDRPLAVVGWNGPAEDHPVGRAVIAAVGNGARGGDVRRQLKSAPTGWPQDAIDAVLVALRRAGLLTAMINGRPVPPEQLNQTQIQAAEFRPERFHLGAEARIALRGLYRKAGVDAKSGEEEPKAIEFLAALQGLARDAGGDPPLPACPATTTLDRLKRLTGTEQLQALLDAKGDLEACIEGWSALKQRALQRVPAWTMLTRLVAHAATLRAAEDAEREMEALRGSRGLLDDVDHVSPLRAKISGDLRRALTERFQALSEAIAAGTLTLEEDACWRGLAPAVRTEILRRFGITTPSAPSIGTDQDLLEELDRQGLAARTDAVAAVSERVREALAEAARRSAPKTQRLGVRPALLSSEADVKAWLAEHEQKLIGALQNGPVIIG